MEQNNAERRAEYLQQNKKRQRRKKIVSILACVVVFCTTYALILPAITMTKLAKVLTCPLSVHEHVDSCYNEDGDLICGQADFVVHTHGEDCFNKGGDLICELPEIKVHKHTDACYDTEQALVCDKTEVVLHRHTEDCYDENGELICGQLEVLEHTHENGCFTEVKKSELDAQNEVTPADDADTTELNAVAELESAVRSKPMMAAGPMKLGEANSAGIDITNMITEVTVDRREAGTSRWLPEDINNVKAKIGDELRFTLSYDVPIGRLNLNNPPLTYHVPNGISLINGESGAVLDSSGKSIGSYNINADGHISIQFNEEYAAKNATSPILGHISFSASVENIGVDEDGTTRITFKDGIEIPVTVKDTEGDLTVEKTSSNVNITAGTVDYEIIVRSAHGTLDNVTLTDLMNGVKAYGPITVRYGSKTETINPTKEGDSFRYVLPRMAEGDEYHITYSAQVAKPEDLVKSTVTGTNTVSVSSTDSLGFPIEAHDSTKDEFTKHVIEKSGKKIDDNTVEWQIVINSDKLRISLDGWELSDSVGSISATISPDPATGVTGSIATILLPYTFPKGSGDRTYTITYQRSDGVTKNTAILTGPGYGESVSAEGEVGVGKIGLSKHDTAMYPAGVDADGNYLITCEWDVTVDTMTAGIKVMNPASLLGVNNFSYWQLQDNPSSGIPHFFTLEQLQDTADSMVEGIVNSGYQGNYYIFATGKGGLNPASGNDIVLMRWSNGTTPDAVWNDYIKDLRADITYENIFIVFDSDYQGGILNFHSYTTLNVGNGNSEIRNNKNNIYLKHLVGEKDVQDSASPAVTYKPIVMKYDATKTSRSGTGVTEHSEKELTLAGYPEYKVLQWDIDINLPEKEYAGDVVITETLPEGIKLLPEDVLYNGGSVEGNPNAHDGAENLIFYVDYGWALNDKQHAGFNFKPGAVYIVHNNGQVSISTDSNGICTISNAEGQSVWAQKVDDSTYEIHIPYATVQYLIQNKYPVKLEVKAYIDDSFQWDSLTKEFTNQVTISSGSVELGSTTQTQKITRNVVTKASDGYHKDTHLIPYSIILNPNGTDLVDGTDRITLVDTMSYTMPDGAIISATLDNDSVHVYRTDGNEDEDITTQCHYTISDTYEGANVTHKMTMDLPDSIPLRVEYAYRLIGDGTISEIKNVAQIEGDSGSASDEHSEKQVAVEKSSADAVVVGINVYKVDSTNYAVHLNGAKFALKKWNAEQNIWIDVVPENGTYETEDDGMFNTGKLDEYTAYRLIETAPPPGYLMNAGVTYDFYIVSTGQQQEIPHPDDFKGSPLYVGANIYIENDAAPYELPETGGMGTAMYYAAGGMLMLAAVLLVCRKRRNAA